MFLKEINISNYKSYYNQCKIEFTEGLNLISGHVGSGKSNLFDSFQWLLYEKTDGKSPEEFANQKKLFEIKTNQSSEIIECFVSVIFNDKSIDYTLKRSFTLSLKKSNWVVDNENFSIEFEDPKTLNYNLLTTLQGQKNDIDDLLNRLLPKKISKYIWFQGETLEKLIDFTDPTTLENAVDFISYLNVYSKMGDTSTEMLNLIKRKLDNKHSAEVRESNKYKKAQQEKVIAKVAMDSSEKKIKEFNDEIKSLRSELKECNDKLSLLADFPQLLANETQLKADLSNVRSEKFKHYEDIKKHYINKWILKGCDSLISKGLDEFEKFNDKEQALINANNKQLREGVPGDKLINKMLTEETCLICLRDAPNGSEHYKNIERNLDKNKEIKILDPEMQAQRGIISSFGSFPKKIHNIINNIDTEIIDCSDKEDRFTENENKLNKELDLVKDEISALVTEKGSKIKNLNSKSITNKRNLLETQIETKINQLNFHKTIYDKNKNIFSVQEKALQTLLPKSTKHPEKEAVEYIEYINELIDVRTIEEKKYLIKKIEKTTNEIQKNIVEKHEQKLIVLYAEIDENDFSLSFIDKDGNSTPGHGAQKALVKMSIISAILKLSNDFKGQSFPFITDAPASDFDIEMTIPFLESVSTTFNQSIVILKDVKDQLLSLKKEKYISSIKKITLKSTENIKASMSNSYTHIENF